MRPVADDAEALELLALHVDPVRGELAALVAELVDRHLVLVPALGAVLLLDLPLDRQAVAVPARHVVGIVAEHLRFDDEILEDLVERVADMDVAVGVGRAVMQHELRAALRPFWRRLLVEVHVVPALQQSRLALGQARRASGKSVCGRNSVLLQSRPSAPAGIAASACAGARSDARSADAGRRLLLRLDGALAAVVLRHRQVSPVSSGRSSNMPRAYPVCRG